MNKLRFYTLIRTVDWESITLFAVIALVICMVNCFVFAVASEWMSFLTLFSYFFAAIGLTILIFFPIPLALNLLRDVPSFRNWVDAKIKYYTGSPRPDDAFPYKFELYECPSSEGGGFVVIVPALDGCISQGDTANEAIEMAKDAVRCWCDVAKDRNETIPTPDNHLG